MEKYTDKQLIELIASNVDVDNDRAFKSIYQDKYKLVEKLIKHNSGSDKDARDIFQEVLIVFYHKCKSSDFKLTCSVQSFLYAVAKNLWMNQLKKNSRTTHINDFLQETVQIDDHHFDVLIKQERKNELLSYMDKMCTSCKSILQLYYFKKMRMAEIVEQMELSNEQVARNKKSKCMKKLRAIIFNTKDLNI